MSDVTISMVMIAKDEEANVERCFDSFWDDVDEVVLVDTGSTDGTIAAARAYAEARGDIWTAVAPGGMGHTNNKLKIGHFEWCDDFAAARNYADTLATGTWRAWIDLDDEAHGLPHLRKLAGEVEPGVMMLYAIYEYAFDETGHCFCELWRERLVRAAANTEWIGPVHECQIGRGSIVRVDKEDARWVHHRSGMEIRDRNELLLRKWLEDEPDNPRAESYLAFELMGSRVQREVEGQVLSEPDREKIAESIPHFQRYLSMPNQPADARAQTARRCAQALMVMGLYDEAQAVTLPLLAECPWWPDSLLTLAEVAHEKQEWARTIDFSNQVLQRGQPDTMLIVNPEDYTLRPRVLIASAMASLGKLEEACKTAQQVVDVNPGYMNMQAQLAEWMGALARDQAGTMWANCAQLLIQNDEPEKAIVLLQTPPYFTADHPAIIATRVAAANALSEPYQLEPVSDSARGRWLVRNLHEQMETANTLEEVAA